MQLAAAREGRGLCLCGRRRCVGDADGCERIAGQAVWRLFSRRAPDEWRVRRGSAPLETTALTGPHHIAPVHLHRITPDSTEAGWCAVWGLQLPQFNSRRYFLVPHLTVSTLNRNAFPSRPWNAIHAFAPLPPPIFPRPFLPRPLPRHLDAHAVKSLVSSPRCFFAGVSRVTKHTCVDYQLEHHPHLCRGTQDSFYQT